MPFKMKGSPLNALGDKKKGIIRVPSSAKTKTTGPMQGPMPQNMLTPSETRGEVAATMSKHLKPIQRLKATKIRATSIGAIDAITGTPLNAVGDITGSESSGNAFQKAASKLGVKDPNTTKSTETPKSRKEMKVDKMANKVSDAPKSRKEMRLAKTKNKAAKVKSDYNAGSKGPMEGKAARAKHDRLNKRADRIEERIAKKNKK